MRRRTKAREYALQLLYKSDITKNPEYEALDSFWKEEELEEEVREFSRQLFSGVIQNLEVIDNKISGFAENWDLKRMAVVDRNILRMGSYELIYMSDIPPKVSINEAVDLAKKYSGEEAGKFVNGILDRIREDAGKE